MSTAPKPTVRATCARLRDGTQVIVRPARPHDARYADAFFQWLSEETKRLRFVYRVKELTPEILAAALAQDGLKRVALKEIERGRGTTYDAAVADACIRLFTEKGFALGAVST